MEKGIRGKELLSRVSHLVCLIVQFSLTCFWHKLCRRVAPVVA